MPEGTRERLILTAEQLFASKGIESVSLREIARTAGQKNVAALQYHFGDREGLFSAILEYRMSGIEQVREGMLREADNSGAGDNMRELVRCLVVPMMEHIRSAGPDSHYIEFLARLQVSFPAFLENENRNKPWQQRVLEISNRLEPFVPASDALLRQQRQLMMGACMIHSVAAFERGLREGRYQIAGLDSFAGNLVDALCGILSAAHVS